MTRTCTLCGAPVDVEVAQARAVFEQMERRATDRPARWAHRAGGRAHLVAHARCTDPLCGLLELIDLEAVAG